VTNVTTGEDRAAELRNRLTDELIAAGHISSAAVEAAFRAVPRHLFAPGVPIEAAYARDIVVVKRDEHGALMSTISAPEIQALQLEQAGIRPGMRVLEIGSGGCNAALIAELTGPDGHVTTMDIDPDVADRARACLDAAGYPQVRVALGDAEDGLADGAPYDRILVTVGAWDIPPSWTRQLAEDGRIVVPLRTKGLTMSLALEREGDHLISRSQQICGFVKMQGAGAHDGHRWPLGDHKVSLAFDDGNLDDPRKLDGVLTTAPAAAWSGVTARRGELLAGLLLWLMTTLPGFCTLVVDASDGDPGLAVEPGGRWFPFATVDGDSFAYLSVRPTGEDVVELGAHGYGPHAKRTAEAIAEQIRVWDRDHRNGPGPTYTIWPIGTPDEALPAGAVIDKRHTRVTVSWPHAAQPARE
jgi:Protein-L-isoaspartate carboxylmethyltransferase